MNRNIIQIDSFALAGRCGGGAALCVLPGGPRPIPVAPIAMMLPTFLGPLLMVIGEASADEDKAK